MATRSRYKSPSPVPSPSTKQRHEPSDALSASHFHAQYPQFQNSRPDPPHSHSHSHSHSITEHYYDHRFPPPGRYPQKRQPELPILTYHNAAPEHFSPPALVGDPVPIVLPPVNAHAGGHRYSPPRPQQQQGYGDGLVADTPFGYAPKPQYSAHVEPEKPRSLSIQSLISPGLTEPMTYPSEQHTRKRKGSDAGDSARGTRHGSLVPTSVSIEDPDVREVVEALGGLKGDFAATSPPLQQSRQAQPLTTAAPENEPLIDLITHRAHPLLSSAIATSLSTYAASKSYSPSFRYAAESVENRVGLPVSNVVSAVGRHTGLEGVLRRGLQRTNPNANANGSQSVQRTDNNKKRKTRSDAEKRQEEDEAALKALVQQQHQGLVPTGSTQEEREREQEHALENQTWQKRLMLSTSGLGVALNDESLKNLKYCLQWLRFLNVHLSKLVTALRNVVEELDNHHQQQQQQNASNGAVVAGGGREVEGSFGRNLLPAGCEGQRVALAAKVEGLRAEVVGTMKKVVEVVSNYTGSALPDNTRDLIKRHIFSLPQRFAAANASAPASPTTASKQLVPSNAASNEEDQNSPRSSANRVMVLAKEGLDMMQQVSFVVEGTIIRAEEWCERLGKKKHEEEGGQGVTEGEGEGEEGPEKKKVSWKTKFEGLEERRASRDRDGDIVMDGNGGLRN